MITPLLFALASQTRPPLAEAKAIAAACAKAFRAKDRPWFERHLADRFVYEDMEKERQDRAAMLERLERWFHPFAYRVEPSLSLVSARRAGKDLVILSDLKVVSQPIRFWRTPVTETIVRVETYWLRHGPEWAVYRMLERSSRKTVDGQPVKE